MQSIALVSPSADCFLAEILKPSGDSVIGNIVSKHAMFDAATVSRSHCVDAFLTQLYAVLHSPPLWVYFVAACQHSNSFIEHCIAP